METKLLSAAFQLPYDMKVDDVCTGWNPWPVRGHIVRHLIVTVLLIGLKQSLVHRDLKSILVLVSVCFSSVDRPNDVAVSVHL